MPKDEVEKIITDKVKERLGEASKHFTIKQVSPKYERTYDDTEFAGYDFEIEI